MLKCQFVVAEGQLQQRHALDFGHVVTHKYSHVCSNYAVRIGMTTIYYETRALIVDPHRLFNVLFPSIAALACRKSLPCCFQLLALFPRHLESNNTLAEADWDV